jgi:hypothetical protein
MNTIIFWSIWLGCLPVGYIACRWAHRATGSGNWTQLDRLGAIVFSLVGGPMLPVWAAVMVALWKLMDTKWAGRNARW